MQAFIISIGEELLIGQTINTNAAWIAAQLNQAGSEVREVRVITDKKTEILRCLREAEDLADLVLITGGLGPTRDDVTRDALCEYFDCGLVVNEDILGDITTYMERRGRKITDVNRDQAMVPEKASIIRNPYGTAPGFWFRQGDKSFIAMPGVPYEMKEMVLKHIVPALESSPREQHIVHKTVLTHGVGESVLLELIADWENNLPAAVRLAYLPSTGIVKLRLTGKGSNKETLLEIIGRELEKLKQIIPEYIWGFDDDSLEGVTGRLLAKKGKSLATAESCTGGFIAHKITSIPGSSAYFKGSIVAYANKAKEHLLGVSHELLDTQGAVCRQVAEDMAAGARQTLEADYAIGVTGIAGPGGGSKSKPAGTTWIAIAGEHEVISQRFAFGDNRERNISRAANAALAMLKDYIERL